MDISSRLRVVEWSVFSRKAGFLGLNNAAASRAMTFVTES